MANGVVNIDQYQADWTTSKVGYFADNKMELITEATFRQFATDTAALLKRGPNQSGTGTAAVMFLTQAEADDAHLSYLPTLEGLDRDQLYIGKVVRVEYHPDRPGQEMELVVYNRPDLNVTILRAYADGTLTPYYDLTGEGDGRYSAYWQKKGSNVTGNVPVLDPMRSDYPAAFAVQQLIGGRYFLFRSQRAGGPFRAPTLSTGTADWLPVALTPPSARADAQELEYMQVVVIPQEAVEAGMQYAITGPWDEGNPRQIVYVTGLSSSQFEPVGTLFTGVLYTPVLVDVLAGTTTALATSGPGGGIVDAYTKAESAALLAEKLNRQDFADLIGAAPAALDSIHELAAELLTSEATITQLLAIQQQQTQQIAALQKNSTILVLPFVATINLDFARKKQRLSLLNNVGFGPALNKAEGAEVELHLRNSTATDLILSFPNEWTFVSPRPGVLAAGAKAVLTITCAWGSAEDDITAGYAAKQ